MISRGLDRVDRTFHRDAADAVRDEADVDRAGGNHAGRAAQIARRHGHSSQVAERDHTHRQRFLLARKRLAAQRSADLRGSRRVVVVHVLHVVALEHDVAAALIFRVGLQLCLPSGDAGRA